MTSPSSGTVYRGGPIAVTWNPTTDALSGLDHYEVVFDGQTVMSTTGTSTTLPGLPVGLHVLQVRAVDHSGNGTLTAPANVTVDVAPPSDPKITSPVSQSTALPTLAWSPSTDAESGIAGYDVVVDNKATYFVSSTSLTVPSPLATGAHVWGVRAVDDAGNVSNVVQASFTVGKGATVQESSGSLRLRLVSQVATLTDAVRKGVRVDFAPSRSAMVGASLLASPATAKNVLGVRANAPLLVGRSAVLSVDSTGATGIVRFKGTFKRKLLRARSTVRLQLVVAAYDAAGNTVTKRVSLLLTPLAASTRRH